MKKVSHSHRYLKLKPYMVAIMLINRVLVTNTVVVEVHHAFQIIKNKVICTVTSIIENQRGINIKSNIGEIVITGTLKIKSHPDGSMHQQAVKRIQSRCLLHIIETFNPSNLRF